MPAVARSVLRDRASIDTGGGGWTQPRSQGAALVGARASVDRALGGGIGGAMVRLLVCRSRCPLASVARAPYRREERNVGEARRHYWDFSAVQVPLAETREEVSPDRVVSFLDGLPARLVPGRQTVFGPWCAVAAARTRADPGRSDQRWSSNAASMSASFPETSPTSSDESPRT